MKKTAEERISELNRFGSILGLERMAELLEFLDHPEQDLKIIHVAGTNGKGSTCKFIYEVLQANGYQVGLYSSPYIEVFHERIAFNGNRISNEDLERYTDIVLREVDNIVSLGHDSPTEFEVVTAIALLYFKEKGANFVILEVGLGGRGDSTNVIEKPLISIITSIDYDHTERLGNTLAEIAGEKAGIIKKGVPVISNVANREAVVPIARKAYETGAVLYDVSKIKASGIDAQLEGQSFDLLIDGTDYSNVEISMIGEHQIENAKTALAALENLRRRQLVKVERSKVYEGMKKAMQPGRLEIVSMVPCVILDGAHNKAGAEALEKTINDIYSSDARILMVVGILEDKDISGMTRAFQKVANDFIVTEIHNARTMKAQKLAEYLDAVSGSRLVEPDALKAVKKALSMADEFDAIIVAGSLYLVGEVRKLFF